MVGTLIKHEFLRTRRWLGVVFGIVTLVTLVGALTAWTGWPLISQLGVGLSFIGVGAFLMIVQVGLAWDYWRSSYSKTGYFTQSLPVKGATIYWSKLLWGCAVTMAAIVWNLVLALVAYLGTAGSLGVADPLRQLRETLGLIFDVASPLTVLGIAVGIVILFLGGLAQYYFAASIGSESRMNRLGIGGPVLVWLGLYMVMQVLLFLGIIAVPVALGIGPDGGLAVVSMNFLEAMVHNQNADAMPLGFVPVLPLVTAALIWRTVVSWNAKVSLA
ncbi:MAG: hypothetical protein L0H41_14580 [Microlunatus sp.]|nr:hypothetical protein [Microlunatus sp.]